MAHLQRERELKLGCPPGFVLPDLSGLGHPQPMDPLRLAATYFDTADLRLARWGVTLRRRSGGHDDAWTVKLTDAQGRLEVTLPLGAATSPPAELRALVTAFSRGARLRKAATVDTRRSPVRVRGPEGPLAEVVVDVVDAWSEGVGASSWSELEVEALADEVDLSRYARLLRAAGAEDVDQTPKALRALGPTALLPGDPPLPGRLRLGDPSRSLVEHAVRTHTRALVLQDSRVRLDLDDAVHQMRVAARRLRSALRTLRPLLEEEWCEQVRAELSHVGHRLGAARDAEVGLQLVTGVLEEVGADSGVLSVVTRAYDVPRAQELAVAALSQRRWPQLLDDLVSASTAPPTTKRASKELRQVAPRLVEASWDHLQRRADALRPRRSEPADYHRVRVLAKRARYAAELVAPAYGKPARRLAKKLTQVQDALGDQHDCLVAIDVLRDVATRKGVGAAHAFVLGQACQLLNVRAEEHRADFHECWPEVRRARHRRWLS